MHYTFSKTIDNSVYSIDMLYIRGYLTYSINSVKDYCSSLCTSHKSFKGRSKYSWFQEQYVFDGVTIYVGLFDEFNKISRSWNVIPMAEIRFNPNKYPDNDFVKYFLSITDSRYIRKFDFACDIPCETKYILVMSNRTVSSINNGDTRYYGAFGSDGHVKVYDKQKELLSSSDNIDISHPLTRIELTLTSQRIDKFIQEKFYRLDYLNLDLDSMDSLNDTDIAILNLYMRLKVYEPNIAIEDYNLGRRKEKKIKDALLSSSPTVVLDFNSSVMITLLGLVSSRYECSIKPINKQLLNDYSSSEDDLPLPI